MKSGRLDYSLALILVVASGAMGGIHAHANESTYFHRFVGDETCEACPVNRKNLFPRQDFLKMKKGEDGAGKEPYVSGRRKGLQQKRTVPPSEKKDDALDGEFHEKLRVKGLPVLFQKTKLAHDDSENVLVLIHRVQKDPPQVTQKYRKFFRIRRRFFIGTLSFPPGEETIERRAVPMKVRLDDLGKQGFFVWKIMVDQPFRDPRPTGDLAICRCMVSFFCET